ncbi:hypothetical protein WN943_004885 [Citrus x changshan-huyou]
MQEVSGYRGPVAKGNEHQKVAADGIVPRDVVTRAGTKGGKGEGRETNLQGEKLEKAKSPAKQNAGDFKWGENGVIMGMGHQHKPYEISAHVESEVEEIDNGPRMEETKPKKKKWKCQARKAEATMEIKPNKKKSSALAAAEPEQVKKICVVLSAHTLGIIIL